ncbi:MAG: hypothetical protein U5O15_02465 [Candidatus Krumholzibacteriota bacterium]|nr:hypothetical protein [Candidatus Krumholzibacteriota bacterium]
MKKGLMSIFQNYEFGNRKRHHDPFVIGIYQNEKSIYSDVSMKLQLAS